jgi:Fe-S cluster biogenesis protein NfuA
MAGRPAPCRRSGVGKTFAYEEGVDTVELVDTIIEQLRPALNADGGDIEVIGIRGDVVRVKLTGACAGCPSAEMTLRLGLEAAVRRVRPGLRVVAEPAPSGPWR